VSGQPMCPQCSTPVELDWEWCHNCGFDPESKRPQATAPAPLLSRASTPLAGGGGPAPGGGPSAFPAPPAGYDSQASDSSSHDSPPYESPSFGDSSFEASSFDTSSFSTSFEPTSFEPTSFAPPPPDPPSLGAGGAFDALQAPPGTRPPPAPPPDDRLLGSASPLPPPPAPPPGARTPIRKLPPALGAAPSSFATTERPVGAPGARRLPNLRPTRRSLPTLTVPPVVRKAAIIGVAGAVVLGGLSLVLVKAGGDPHAATSSSTLDPKAPPPIGQLQLGSRTTSTAPPEMAAGWTTYKSPDGTFAANFPGKATARGYQRTYQKLTQNGLEAFLQVGQGGPIYSAAYIDLLTASAYADSQDLFDQGLADNYDDQGPFEVNPGLQAVSFTKKPGAGPTTRGFVLVKGKRAYILETMDVSDEDLHLFLTGFRWLNDPTG
jgi:hypothetical protein